MVTKIKGKRLNPNAVRDFNGSIVSNINTLEVKVNAIIDVLKRNGLS